MGAGMEENQDDLDIEEALGRVLKPNGLDGYRDEALESGFNLRIHELSQDEQREVLEQSLFKSAWSAPNIFCEDEHKDEYKEFNLPVQ